MPKANVTTNVTLITRETAGLRNVFVQNLGAGVLYLEKTPGDNSTISVNSTNSVYVGVNSTIYVDLYHEALYAVSNSTADVRYI